MFFAGGDLFGQSILDALQQPSINADLEQLNQANQASQNSWNSLAKRANLLQRRVETLRSQADQLEQEVKTLRAERMAFKAAVIECRDQIIAIFELIEKQDLAAIATPLEQLRTTYTKSLLSKLQAKDAVEAGATAEDPSALNPAAQSPAAQSPAPQPAVTEQPAKQSAIKPEFDE